MKLLTTAEAALRLSVTPRRVRALIATGRLPAKRYGAALLIEERHLARVAERKAGRPAKKVQQTPLQTVPYAV